MLSPIDSAAAPRLTTGGQSPTTPKASSVDFENFLQLLTAQLRYQDPLSPLDSTQFVAQLASFSTVEQLVNANQQLTSIAGGLSNQPLSDYADWIGRNAETASAPLQFEGSPVQMRVTANASADTAEVVVRDATGAVVGRIPVANSDGVLTWDGATISGGTARSALYSATTEYYKGGDLVASAPTSSYSLVVGARIADGRPMLQLASGVEISPDQVTGLRAF